MKLTDDTKDKPLKYVVHKTRPKAVLHLLEEIGDYYAVYNPDTDNTYTAHKNCFTVKEKTMQLYQITGTEEYGTKCGQDSQGRILIEIKGSGQIKAVTPDRLEEVLPYTVSLRWLRGGAYSTRIAKPDQVKVGDLIADNGNLAQVTAIDTKDRDATKHLSGVRVVTEELK